MLMCPLVFHRHTRTERERETHKHIHTENTITHTHARAHTTTNMIGACAYTQKLLLWMLPAEVWQEVLGFCPFDEYARLVGMRSVEEGSTWISYTDLRLRWASQPPSREFYHLLKLSLLEMRFHTMLPSPSLGGLWLASRGLEARFIRKLRLGGCGVFFSSVCECLCVRVHVCMCERQREKGE